MRPEGYATLVFDCDGVILDSNRVKTEAFRQAAMPYGEAAADRLVAHHTAHGGVSRYRKFEHFIAEIVEPGCEGPGLEALLERYAAAVQDGLMACGVAEGLADLRAATPDARWLVVSGGDQAELRDVFGRRGLDVFFDGGIFGSPDTKDEILAREIAGGNIRGPALFLGDSRYDHQAASAAGLDFVFLRGWSEFAGWEAYAQAHGFPIAEKLSDLPAMLGQPG